MVVAHEIPTLIPRREKWRENKTGRSWGFDVSRRTNPEDRGKRTYRWWRPCGYTLRLAGRAYKLGTAVTIWHIEPDGRDALTVCRGPWKDGKPDTRWKWHIRHWHLQVHVLQAWRARLFDRCAECGRKGRPNFSHQWDNPRIGWRKWHSRPGLYHYECSSLLFVRGQLNDLTKYVQGEADQTTRWRVEYRLKNLDEKAAQTTSV